MVRLPHHRGHRPDRRRAVASLTGRPDDTDLPEGVSSLGVLAEQLCGWVDKELEGFTPWHEPGATRPSSLQRFAELAIAFDVLSASPLEVASPEARWRPFILHHVRQPAFGELARARLEWAAALLLPYLVMRRQGEVSAYHDATLREARRAGFPRALEVVPYRALDYAYFAERSGLVGHGDEAQEELLARTFAARVSCRYAVSNEAAYGLTHAVFYASNFGQEPVSADHLANAAPVVDSLIVDACIRRRLDLLGELLIASLVLPGTREDVRRLGVRVFFSTLGQSGSLIPHDGSERTFDACYHTTLVGLILCASWARAMSSTPSPHARG